MRGIYRSIVAVYFLSVLIVTFTTMTFSASISTATTRPMPKPTPRPTPAPTPKPTPPPQASLNLQDAKAAVSLRNETTWSLTKSANIAGDVVTFTVDAIKGTTSPNFIKANGYLTLSNTTGSGPATIGSIVVNLQRKSGLLWKTVASDIANANDGDTATTAKICPTASSELKTSFTENSASGTLNFSDASNNTVFSLSPQQTIAAGTSVSLLFRASFNNTILAVPVGEQVRFEVIVSFGNAGSRSTCGFACANIDISGNGAISADEAFVRSVPVRMALKIPALQQHNASVTLTDDATHVALAGTATTTDFATDIGGGTGTETISASATRAVSMTADGGTSGGTVTNCANIDSPNSTTTLTGPINRQTGLPLYSYTFIDYVGQHTQTCATVDVNADETGFQIGDIFTYGQETWGDIPNGSNPAQLLRDKFTLLYPAGATIGATRSAKFSSALAVQNFLPAAGAPDVFNATLLLNPLSTSAGSFAGQVLALKFNVDMDDSGFTAGTLPTAFGDLYVNGTGDPAVDGMKVRDILAIANQVIGGVPVVGYTASSLDALATNLNFAFDGGTPSAWAIMHLSTTP